jgi:hypothetical protein
MEGGEIGKDEESELKNEEEKDTANGEEVEESSETEHHIDNSKWVTDPKSFSI